jgi:hypothetical protein
MRTEKNIVVAGGTAAVGSAAAPYLTSQTLILEGDDTISLMRPHSPNLPLCSYEPKTNEYNCSQYQAPTMRWFRHSQSIGLRRRPTHCEHIKTQKSTVN